MSFTAVIGFFFAPVAKATPVNYDFSVFVNSGPLHGTTLNGTFSYDDSSIVPGGANNALDLLTALDFTLNGTTYDASTANTGKLTFDAVGNLTSFIFGTTCTAGQCTLSTGAGSFLVSNTAFAYFVRRPQLGAGTGTTSYSPVTTPVPVPEPGTLGLFGLGALLLGLFVGARRRMC
ncbi:PEP-CTERM sorting domain-containing protein [Rhodanobacter lindaniclasticus]